MISTSTLQDLAAPLVSHLHLPVCLQDKLLPAVADTNDARKISANWAADEDISRLLKSLPNWTNLVATPATPTKTPMKEPIRASVLSPGTPAPESDDQVY